MKGWKDATKVVTDQPFFISESMQVERNIHKQVCIYLRTQHPNVIFTTDLNGIRLPIGLSRQIEKLKSCRGIPDLIIFYAAGGYNGLLLEIKRDEERIYVKNGELTKDGHTREQAVIIERLRDAGYAAFFVCGLEAAIACINDYWNEKIKKSERLEYLSPRYENEST